MHEENFLSSWLREEMVGKDEKRKKEDKKNNEEVKRKGERERVREREGEKEENETVLAKNVCQFCFD